MGTIAAAGPRPRADKIRCAIEYILWGIGLAEKATELRNAPATVITSAAAVSAGAAHACAVSPPD
jgi:hypothetical protein